MSVWFAIPSIRPNGGTVPIWKRRGYKVAVLRQGGKLDVDLDLPTDRYWGWAASINLLTREILSMDTDCQWVVTGGDDIEPDLAHSPDEIAAQLTSYFGGTFGVCQPTGDRWSWGGGPIIERIAGSPWLGREWCERAYSGNGPLYDGYLHCFSDEELQQVAIRLGVFWQRPDLIHLHQHWGRGAEPKPEWWDGIAGADYHNARPLFELRRASGFPGHEPLPVLTTTCTASL